MPEMNGGRAVVESLRAERVELVFGIPGVHTLEIYDALGTQSEVRHILTRHEQGAGFMADGYARSTGRVGVVIAITGPGVTNMATPLGEAYADGSALLLVSSEIESRYVGQARGCLHELKNQLGFTGQLVKWNACACRVEDIPRLISAGVEEARSGRPGPVHVQIPLDVLEDTGMVEIQPSSVPRRQGGDPEKIREAVALLKTARRPLIYAGRGVVWAEATGSLIALADALSAAVLTTTPGKDAFPADHPLFLGCAWRGLSAVTDYLEGVDVALAVGNRLSAMETANWTMPLPSQLIQVDVEPEQVGRNYPVPVGIAGDVQEVLTQIVHQLGMTKPSSPSEEVECVRDQVSLEGAERAPRLAGLMADIRQILPRDAIVSLDATTAGYWMGRHFPVFQPRTVLNPRSFLTLGFGFPAALGAKVAYPDRAVVAVVGDGGFLFTGQELATAMLHGLSVPILLFNDSSYGAVKRRQLEQYGGRVVAVDLVNPDFVLLARAFGAEGTRVESLQQVAPVLAGALESPVSTLIEIPWQLVEPD